METIHETDLKIAGLKLVARGKVRDIYDASGLGQSSGLEKAAGLAGREILLVVATDRLSAFDVVMDEPIPGKGVVLTMLSNFWFARTAGVIENHIIDPKPWESRDSDPAWAALKGRAILVKKARPAPIEAVVRGYLSGSAWAEYSRSGTVCGSKLPAGLKESAKLPEPIFTPSTKAPQGEHDENISFSRACDVAGREMAMKIRDASLRLYAEASAHARERGIIIADTKFEFGAVDGKVIVIDEMLTPDSSRFWPLDGYKEGGAQPSFDKQFVRDYLLSIKWGKKPPPPPIPAEIVAKTAAKYREALSRLDPSNEALGWI